MQVMGHHHAGQAHRIVELANQPRSGSQRNRVQAGEGFVVHQQFRIQRNGAGQCYPPGHATGNLSGHQVTRAAQAHRIELHQHNIAQHGRWQIRVFAQGKRHIVKNTQIGEQGSELEQHAHAAAGGKQGILIQCPDVLLRLGAALWSSQQQLPALGAVLSANEAQNRGFSAS